MYIYYINIYSQGFSASKITGGFVSIITNSPGVFSIFLLQAVDAAGKKIKDAKGFEDKASDLSKPQTRTNQIKIIFHPKYS